MRATLFGIVLILVGCNGEKPGASPTPSPSTVVPDTASPKTAELEDEKGSLIHCPVAGMKGMEDCCQGGWCGRKPKPGLTTAYKGGVVQFCCKECIEDFKNSTSKFAAVANHQLVTTGQARQERCPVTGEAFDPAISAEVAGVVIRFANDGARATIRNANEAQRVIFVFGDSAFGKAFRIVEKK